MTLARGDGVVLVQVKEGHVKQVCEFRYEGSMLEEGVRLVALARFKS